MKKLAVFDIDGTLFRSSLLIELTNELILRKIFPKSTRIEIDKDFKAWVNREGDYESYIRKVINSYEDNIVGCLERDIERCAIDVLEKEKRKLYRYTRNLIQELKSRNYFLFAISGSPGHILTSFAKDMGFDKYLGGYYEIVDGKFTGRQPFGNPSYDKKKTLTQFLEKNRDGINLEDSIGVGDTESDIAFLEMVDNPIAFNPNKRLVDHAKRRGWKIIIERKDVIYDISKFELLQAS